MSISSSQSNHGTDHVIAIDLSGSMSDKVGSLVSNAASLLMSMNVNDRFRIFTFTDEVHELSDSFETVTPATVSKYVGALMQLRPFASSSLNNLMKKVLESLRSARVGNVVSIHIITDGDTLP